ncbi:YT521-B-like domain-containing protein [Mycena amicta]|nr:YT521-B-like domain-containing protein [Mycena amicta]
MSTIRTRHTTRPARPRMETSGAGLGGAGVPAAAEVEVDGGPGVLSIFLISRSNCAFVNYETEAHLQRAITRFNGIPLRPADPRCPRLVCRVRRKDDDLKAGVGGQRGMGLHMRWVKERDGGGARKGRAGKERERERDDASSVSESVSDSGTPSSTSDVDGVVSALSLESEGDDSPGRGPSRRLGVASRPPPRPHATTTNSSSGSGSGSHASTDSSLLRQYFPQRYFILKSLTRDDLDLSVSTGLWATQKHNEGILDRAFRTSKDVFLVFGVNKSGEFYGYARMAGPIGQGQNPRGAGAVPWTRRDSSASSKANSPSALRPPLGGQSTSQPTPDATTTTPSASSQHQQQPIFSAEHFVGESPAPLSNLTPARPPGVGQGGGGRGGGGVQSAPAILGQPHRTFSAVEPALKYSLDHHLLVSAPTRVGAGIELDESAPYRAMRVRAAGGGGEQLEPAATLLSVPEEAVSGSGLGQPEPEVDGDAGEGWGHDFQLEWLCTDRLPFQRTRNIRNPWNHDKEVKVSRDGTELEPGVGRALLEEWRAYLALGGAGLVDGAGAGAGAGLVDGHGSSDASTSASSSRSPPTHTKTTQTRRPRS